MSTKQQSANTGLCVEFHYANGDVGVHPAHGAMTQVWSEFDHTGKVSHIVIRPDTEQGQQVSDVLYAAARTEKKPG